MTRIADVVTGDRPTISFEFFPPKTDAGRAQLAACVDTIRGGRPSFVSVTYGAGGTNREPTRQLVLDLLAAEDYPAMPHLTCTGHTRADLESLVDDYVAGGVENILALAGDPIEGVDVPDELRFAHELVELVRERHDMTVAVAAFPEGHPRSPDLASDRRFLASKLATADLGITQFFYRIDDFLRMRDDLAALGCETPVLPGVMPMVNPSVVRRFAAINGVWFPDELAAAIDAADDADGLAIAVESALELSEELLAEGVAGVHLYCLNRADVAGPLLTALAGKMGEITQISDAAG